MLKGEYIGVDKMASLEKGVSYFLFPNGQKYYYVSKFPNRSAHTGCYDKSLFKLSEPLNVIEEPKVRKVILDKTKIYRARLIWRRQG